MIPEGPGTLLLVAGLIILFIVAFKLLELLTQTFLVAAVSAGFYISTAYLFETVRFSLQTLIFISLTGTILYIVYSILAGSAKIASGLVTVPMILMDAVSRLRSSMREGEKESDD